MRIADDDRERVPGGRAGVHQQRIAAGGRCRNTNSRRLARGNDALAQQGTGRVKQRVERVGEGRVTRQGVEVEDDLGARLHFDAEDRLSTETEDVSGRNRRLGEDKTVLRHRGAEGNTVGDAAEALCVDPLQEGCGLRAEDFAHRERSGARE